VAPTSQAHPFDERRNIRLLYFFTIALAVQPHVAVWIVYLTDFRHLTLSQVALFEGFFWLVSTIAEVPTGAFADRFGRRASFLCAAVIEGFGILAFGLADSLLLLLGSYVLWSVGLAFRSGNASAFLYDSLAVGGQAKEYPRLFGRLSAIWTGATMTGGVLGGIVAGAFTLQTPAFVAVAFYVFAAGSALAMREPPRARPQGSPGLSYLGTIREAGSVLKRNPPIRYMILFEISIALAMVADFVLLQPFLKEQSVPVAYFGFMMLPMRFASVGGSLWGYRVTAALGMRRGIGGTFIVVVAGLALLGAVSHLAAFAGLVLALFGVSLARPSISGYVNDRTEAAVRATIMSVVPLGTAVLFATSIPLVGLVADGDLRLGFATLSGAILLTAGASYLLWLRADAGSHQGPQRIEPLEPVASPA
jgi:MFS family permease